MILNFKHKGLGDFYYNDVINGIPLSHVKKLRRILFALGEAESPESLDIPGFRLHSLKGDLKEYWSITVNKNWRVIFRFDGRNVDSVDYLDYH
ncbi:type II toxin-antitoxin system RelE/ParE family toxin [Bartonella sp. B41]